MPNGVNFSHPHDGLREELNVSGSFGGAMPVLLNSPPSCYLSFEFYASDSVFVLRCSTRHVINFFVSETAKREQ